MAALRPPRRPPRLVNVLIIVGALGLLIGLSRLVLHQYVAGQLQDWARSIPGCTGMRYAKLSMPFFALQGHLQEATLLFEDGGPITAQSIHVRRFRPGDPLPRVLEADVAGVRIGADHPLVAPLAQDLRELGYAILNGDIQIQWWRRGEQQEAWTVDLMLRMADAGELGLSARLDRVNAEGVLLALENPLNWLLVLPAVELVALRCDYRDQGLFERALAVAARAHGQPPEIMRGAWQRQLQAQSLAEEDPRVQAFWRSLAAYCRHPGRIIILAGLPHPVPVGQLWWLRRPRDIIQRLALECRVE